MTRAVFFDVDFTLIYPGPTFQAPGYQRFCAGHGVEVDASRFERAVAEAGTILDSLTDHVHDERVFIDYIGRIIRRMGGSGPETERCAREIYREWAVNHHFSLYDDVEPAFEALASRGVRIGLISNTHRCLASFQSHFELDRYVAGAISSSEHGYMKPHPSIFRTALRLLRVTADEAVMVGDNVRQDIEGALGVGMRAVWLRRGIPAGDVAAAGNGRRAPGSVPVIRSLRELAALV